MHFLAFPIFLPSAVGDLSDVKLVAGDAVELLDLPLFVGHAAVPSAVGDLSDVKSL